MPLLVVVLLTPVAEQWLGVSGYALAIVIFLIASFTDILDGHLRPQAEPGFKPRKIP